VFENDLDGLNQSSSQQVQRRLRGAPANELAVARNDETAMFGVCIIGECDIHQTDRFLFAAATGPGDTCY